MQDDSAILSPKVEWLSLALCSCLFLITPLYYISLPAQGNWKETTPPLFESIARNIFSFPLHDMEGFIPVRTVNAEYKLAVFLGLASIVIGIVFCGLHLKKRFFCIPKPLLVFGAMFLGSVLVSSVFAHNSQRAWVSSLLWHIIPFLFALSLAHIRWTRRKTLICLGSLITGGIISSLIVMDQHYQWTDWSYGLPRAGLGGLIYNGNFAAEYHAPLLPIVLGLAFYVRSIGARIALGLALAIILLPALSLSLARGAWVGLMCGCVLPSMLFLVVWLLWRKNHPEKPIRPKSFIPPGALLALALALPLYIYTSNHWNKDSRIFSTEKRKEGISSPSTPASIDTVSKETVEFKSITNVSEDGSIQRRLVLWQDALFACLSSDFFLGKGTDHYELHFHESAKLSDKTTGGVLVRFVHNDFIQTFYENGILGLIGFAGVWGWAIWKGLLSCYARAKEEDLKGLGLRLGLVSASLVLLIESFFEFPTRSPCSLMVGWTCLGLLLGLLLQEQKQTAKNFLRSGPRFNLILGALGVLIIPYGCLLAKDLFWTNIYHVQGRVAGDYQQNDKSLSFHRKAISYAPWEHHSRKFECYYLLTHVKQIPQALEAINATLEVHPGCLVAHQNKIAVYLNNGNQTEARKAYRDMKKAAPHHEFTKNEGKRFKSPK